MIVIGVGYSLLIYGQLALLIYMTRTRDLTEDQEWIKAFLMTVCMGISSAILFLIMWLGQNS